MARLSLSSLFGDYAVFPTGLPISVFGESDTAGRVTLALPSGEKREASFIPENGSFSVLLPAVDAYAEEAVLTVVAGDAAYTAAHIAIGVVLLAAGQSNMELMLKEVERPFAPYPSSRMRFYTERHALDEVLGVIDKPASGYWYKADGETELSFSSIGYFVAEMLASALSVTVGVVSCNQGGSRIDAWLSEDAVLKSGVDPAKLYYPNCRYVFNQNHWLYHSKYLLIAPYTYSAVLWYQGESSTGFQEAPEYGRLLHTLIAEWRTDNPNKALPFFLVELAPFDSVKAGWDPKPLGDWASVRAALVSAANTEEGVYTVSFTEVENDAEIHPTNKHPVAEKLFRAIMTALYGASLEYAGPRLLSYTKEGSLLRLSFSHAEGLCLRTKEGAPTDTLADAFFATESGEVPATTGKVEGTALLLAIPKGALSFSLGFCNAPHHNLYNAEGYIASPFRITLSH